MALNDKNRKADKVIDSDDEEDLPAIKQNEEVAIRFLTWNLQGSNEVPPVKDFKAISFPNEPNVIHVFCLQEVRTLDQIRQGIFEALGGKAKFELFEHWMGRSGVGFPGQTALLVYAPKDLCTTGRFRLTRLANSEIKREILRGTRFIFGGNNTSVKGDKTGTMTSSRGAVSMPFSFLDTTFTLVSIRLSGIEEETSSNYATAEKDLEEILELCRLRGNNDEDDHESVFGAMQGTIHHTFLCGSFMGTSLFETNPTAKNEKKPSVLAKKSSALPDSSTSSGETSRKSVSNPISSRLSFIRRKKQSELGNNNSDSASLPVKARFASLQPFEEVDEKTFEFDPDHIFYRCATKSLRNLLKPVASSILTSVSVGRNPSTVLFRLRGNGPELLNQWSRISGNLPLHLSTRSNMMHLKKDVGQRPRMSSAMELRRERQSRANSTASGQSFLSTHNNRQHHAPSAGALGSVQENSEYQLTCTKCETIISNDDEQVPITNDGNAYHLRCFCCDHCGVSLVNTSNKNDDGIVFHEVDGSLLCEQSFQQLFVHVCDECGGALGEEFLTIPNTSSSAHDSTSGALNNSNKRFHISCFHCAECQRPFASKILMGDIVIEAAVLHEGRYLCEADFKRLAGGVKCVVCEHSFDRCIRVNGELYCDRDFKENFAGGVCQYCNKTVEDDDALVLKANDSQNRRVAHFRCLKCCMCNKSLEDSDSSFVEFQNKQYCNVDWLKFSQERVMATCASCNSGIDKDSDIFAMFDRKYHKQCFKCNFCKADLLNNKECFEYGNKVWCLNDYDKFCRTDLPACTVCHRTIGSKEVKEAKKFQQKSWHKACYVCANCGIALDNKQPKMRLNKIYCDKC